MKRASPSRRRRTWPATPETQTDASPATLAGEVVSGPPCAMIEREWLPGITAYLCEECRCDTTDPRTAKAARKACKRVIR